MIRKNNVPPDLFERNDHHEDRIGDAHEAGKIEGNIEFDPSKLETDSTETQVVPHDPFDPAFLGLSQDFAAEANVAKKWDLIKVEKPSKSKVFRVHPTMRMKTTLLVLKDDNETYLVLPSLRQALAGESLCGVFTLHACATKAGTPFLWPIKMADPDGKWLLCYQSAWNIAKKAKERWARMQWNKDAGHYVADYDVRPLDQQQQPAWPDLTFSEWLRLAFQGFTIDTLEHPVLRRLRMED